MIIWPAKHWSISSKRFSCRDLWATLPNPKNHCKDETERERKKDRERDRDRWTEWV